MNRRIIPKDRKRIMKDDDIEKIMDKGSFQYGEGKWTDLIDEKSMRRLKSNIKVYVRCFFMCPQCGKPDWLNESNFNDDAECRFCNLVIPKECFVFL